MDDRTWYLAIGSLVAAFAAVLLDAAILSFNVPDGFWLVPSGALGFLGARAAIKARNGEGK